MRQPHPTPAARVIGAALLYDPTSGNAVWRPRDDASWNAQYAGRSAGTVSQGKLRIMIAGKWFLGDRLFWKLVTGSDAERTIVHRDGDPLNNRFSNLSVAEVAKSAPVNREMHIPTSINEIDIHNGDCLAILATYPDNHFDSIFTDPPYHLSEVPRDNTGGIYSQRSDERKTARKGFMGKDWDGGDIAFQPDTWRQIMRVLKPGGHAAIFGGNRTSHRLACAVEEAGFEIRDQILWLYSGFPKSKSAPLMIDKHLGHPDRGHRVATANRFAPNGFREPNGTHLPPYAAISDEAKEFNGYGTGLKPAYEVIILARKPFSEKTIAANVLKWGTGALNIDASRVPTSNANLGRYPANITHDGSDEILEAFAAFGSSKSSKQRRAASTDRDKPVYTSNTTRMIGPENTYDDEGSPARFYKVCEHDKDLASISRFRYHPKASKADRAGSGHPCVKPVALIQYIAQLINPPGGMILDCFAGSGTLATACLNLGYKATLIEQDETYYNDILNRIENYEPPKPAKPVPIVAPTIVPNNPDTTCQPGDVWTIGPHRLMCGDATDQSDVDVLMQGKKAKNVFTSPPYSQQREYGVGPVDWDTLMQGAFADLPVTHDAQVLVNLGLVHKKGELQEYWQQWVEFMRSTGWRKFALYCWDQGWGLPGDWNGRFAPSFEFVYHFNHVARKPCKTVPKKPENIVTINRATGLREPNGKRRTFIQTPSAGLNTHKIMDSVIRVNRETRRVGAHEHPAIFPVKLCHEIISAYSSPGELWYEPFCGSGTMIVAAQQTGRVVFGMEKLPVYCDIALRRIEKETGLIARRQDGKAFSFLSDRIPDLFAA